jgi:hypothetical protein
VKEKVLLNTKEHKVLHNVTQRKKIYNENSSNCPKLICSKNIDAILRE